MDSIAEWLASLGLSEYAERFAENGIDLSVLRDLTEQDLKDVGVLLGHRRKMLRAIAELDRAGLTGPQAVVAPLPHDAERRLLTVMFCDLVGSTALSARLDPEDVREVIGAYQTCITEVISRYQGTVARYMGDGVLAYFGYPQAHEFDAEQAARAGLEIIAASRGSKRAPASRSGSASALQPGWSWWATSSARVPRRSKRWSATRRTSLPACKR